MQLELFGYSWYSDLEVNRTKAEKPCNESENEEKSPRTDHDFWISKKKSVNLTSPNEMAPRVKVAPKNEAKPSFDQHYRRADNVNKSKTFVTRKNYEKLLPFKKRLFAVHVHVKIPKIPKVYERPVTRSERKRMQAADSNKENYNNLPNDSNVRVFRYNWLVRSTRGVECIQLIFLFQFTHRMVQFPEEITDWRKRNPFNRRFE